ncbi:MAG: hypothetical protein J6S31_02225 [Lachnospiraceae bacterium]|nr:hypothetical protein [Lachnospiraceae bacterium]
MYSALSPAGATAPEPAGSAPPLPAGAGASPPPDCPQAAKEEIIIPIVNPSPND